jgi:small subunit ribosomal protein S20
MANHQSAIKRHRQSEQRRIVNRSNSRRLRTQIKKIDLALAAKNVDEVKKLLSPTLSLIDRSIQKGVLHKNAAGRQKSNLMRKAHTLLNPATTA